MNSSITRLLSADLRTIVPHLLLACGIIYVLWLTASPVTTWVHPELLGTAVYIWSDPLAAVSTILRKIFDWKAFDPNVNRVRPLNDAVEVIDAIARPFMIQWTGRLVVPVPSTILTVLLVPLLLYGWGRRVLDTRLAPVVLILVLILSTGFLSVVVSYIRPAKKLSILLLCALLYFMERSRTDGKPADFWKAAACCYLSFFADEQALINWVTMSVLYWRECYCKGWARIAAMAALPPLFLITTKWILPFLYVRFSVHGAWNALADSKKFTVFAHLLDHRFYLAAVTGLGRSFLTVIGIKSQAMGLVVPTAIAIVALPGAALLRWRTQQNLNWFLAGVAVAVASFYFTLLDWYPFPDEVSYLGSFNYYYHSSIIVLVFCWLAFAWRAFSVATTGNPWLEVLGAGGLPILGFIAAISNASIFIQVNTLVKVIHYYPYSAPQISSALEAASETGMVRFHKDAAAETSQFRAAADKVFGENDRSNGFEPVLSMVRRNSIMTTAHLSHMVKSFYPWTTIRILATSDAAKASCYGAAKPTKIQNLDKSLKEIGHTDCPDIP